MDHLNLDGYELADLLLTAVKSEIDSRKLYSGLSRKVRNAMLRDRFDFLAGEERKHEDFLRKMFGELFPDRNIVVPVKGVVPLPEIRILNELLPLSEVLFAAMKAEEIASIFYRELAERFETDRPRRNMLLYFSQMEMGHYRLLELEKENAERFEEYEQEQEFVHVGP